MTISSKQDRDRIRQKAAEKRKLVQRQQRAETREASAAKMAAGIQQTFGRVKAAEIEAKLSEIPVDTRGLTARLMGDPIPNDPRRPWRNQSV